MTYDSDKNSRDSYYEAIRVLRERKEAEASEKDSGRKRPTRSGRQAIVWVRV